VRRACAFAGAKPAKQKAGRSAIHWPPIPPSAADAPGAGITRWPALDRGRRASLKPGSEISGVPASDTKATPLPRRQRRQNLRARGFRRVCSWVSAKGFGLQPVRVQKRARDPRCLQHRPRSAPPKISRRAQGDVAQIADRRRHHIKARFQRLIWRPAFVPWTRFAGALRVAPSFFRSGSGLLMARFAIILAIIVRRARTRQA